MQNSARSLAFKINGVSQRIKNELKRTNWGLYKTQQPGLLSKNAGIKILSLTTG